jgi:hypothetical protein
MADPLEFSGSLLGDLLARREAAFLEAIGRIIEHMGRSIASFALWPVRAEALGVLDAVADLLTDHCRTRVALDDLVADVDANQW